MKKLFGYLLILLVVGLLGKSSAQLELNYDVYCSGNNGPGEFKDDNACYWKNGQTYNLSPKGSRARGLFIQGDDIYVSGAYIENGYTVACFWKNGELIRLTSLSGTTYSSSIFVNKNDVYVSGHYNNNNITRACYWKNGVKTDLESINNGSCFTRSITVKGKDIYVVGYCSYSLDKTIHIDACYWKNGKIKILNREPYMFSIACEIAFNKDDLIIAGRLDNGLEECLCYWLNDTRVDLFNTENDYSNEQIQIFHLYEHSDYIILDKNYELLEHKIIIDDLAVDGENFYISGSSDKKGLLWDKGINSNFYNENIKNVTSLLIVNGKDVLVVADTGTEIVLYLNNNVLKQYQRQDIKPERYFIVSKG